VSLKECNSAGNWSGTQEPQWPCAERAHRRCAPDVLGGGAREAVAPTAVTPDALSVAVHLWAVLFLNLHGESEDEVEKDV
jgi:hypothetical protein